MRNEHIHAAGRKSIAAAACRVHRGLLGIVRVKRSARNQEVSYQEPAEDTGGLLYEGTEGTHQ